MNIGIISCWRLIAYMLALQLLLFGCTWSAELRLLVLEYLKAFLEFWLQGATDT